jgi:hypothetical protein
VRDLSSHHYWHASFYAHVLFRHSALHDQGHPVTAMDIIFGAGKYWVIRVEKIYHENDRCFAFFHALPGCVPAGKNRCTDE